MGQFRGSLAWYIGASQIHKVWMKVGEFWHIRKIEIRVDPFDHVGALSKLRSMEGNCCLAACLVQLVQERGSVD